MCPVVVFWQTTTVDMTPRQVFLRGRQQTSTFEIDFIVDFWTRKDLHVDISDVQVECSADYKHVLICVFMWCCLHVGLSGNHFKSFDS